MTQEEKQLLLKDNMNYTTIEQSKKLLELGLSPDTADMFYNEEPDEYSLKDIVDTKYPMVIREGQKHYLKEYGVSCWSLGALLELMPLSIVGCDNETYARYFMGNCAEYTTGTSKYDKDLISIPSDSMFKCVYSMVCWLLQNNYIKIE